MEEKNDNKILYICIVILLIIIITMTIYICKFRGSKPIKKNELHGKFPAQGDYHKDMNELYGQNEDYYDKKNVLTDTNDYY